MKVLFRGVAWAGVLFVMAAAAPALAAPDHGAEGHGDAPAADNHGDSHGGGGDHHGDAAHGDDHGEGGHGHHVTYTDDDDEDGTPNWLDPTDGLKENKESYVIESIAWHIVNLALLLGILGYALRKPLGDVFRNREREIRAELTDSARRRDEANQRHQELVARLDKIEGEVKAMEATAEEDAQRDEARLIERAERESERIAEQATRSVRDEATRARNALRRDAVELAVKLAEDTLRSNVASEDQRTLASDFLKSLEQEA